MRPAHSPWPDFKKERKKKEDKKLKIVFLSMHPVTIPGEFCPNISTTIGFRRYKDIAMLNFETVTTK